MSPPAQSPRSPAPDSTTARTASSCSQSVSTLDIAVTMGWVRELMAFGRLRVIRPTPFSTVTRTSSFSATLMQCRSLTGEGQRRGGFSVNELGGFPGNQHQGVERSEWIRNLSNHSAGEEPTVRKTSNPVFRSLPKTQGGYAQFGTGA